MTLRIGILGAAAIAPTAVIGPARTRQDVTVTAVAARDSDRAREFADRHGIAHVLAGYQDLVEAPDVDAVYVATPNHLHGRWAAAAIRAGKHLLVEKPFTANADEARQIADLARGSGLVVMVGMHNRYHPAVARIVDVVRSGELGELLSLDATFTAALAADAGNIRWREDLGGGTLMDQGCYVIDLLRALAGVEPQVLGSEIVEQPSGVDADATVRLAFSGATSDVRLSMREARARRTMSLIVRGTRGTLTASYPFLPHEGNRTVVRTAAGTRDDTAETTSSYDYQLAAFADAVLRGVPVLTGPDDAALTMGVIDSAYVAAGLRPRAPG